MAKGVNARARLTLVLPSQCQQTVHRYVSVHQSWMVKRPPNKVTMKEARKAHHTAGLGCWSSSSLER